MNLFIDIFIPIAYLFLIGLNTACLYVTIKLKDWRWLIISVAVEVLGIGCFADFVTDLMI